VNYLQSLKETGKLNSDLWITSSDNFASWGGGDTSYHCDDLEALIKAVDFVSLHTYPMHDTHYNPRFWGVLESEALLPKVEAVEHAMNRALLYAKKQYTNTKKYVHLIDSTKLVHIGETVWASESIGLYGPNGSNACDEYKAGVYYRLMRQWTKEAGITCFYFEAFNEKWKDPHKINGSENHFGLFTIEGEAKYAIWDLVDAGVFDGLARNNRRIRKTNDGRVDSLLNRVKLPPLKQLK
jgi:exo-beta-1,3-glucanase (GH17 family)